MELAPDIEMKLEKDFDCCARFEVKQILHAVANKPLNVGQDQFIRSLIYLADGDLNKLKGYLPISDPRDIIMLAGGKVGSPNYKFE